MSVSVFCTRLGGCLSAVGATAWRLGSIIAALVARKSWPANRVALIACDLLLTVMLQNVAYSRRHFASSLRSPQTMFGPESETTLRRHIDGLISGKAFIFNEEKLDSKTAAAIRLAMQQDELAQSGPVQSIQFLHVSRQGEDVYIVKLERGEWYGTIALNPSGTISSLGFAAIRTS